MTLCGLGTVQSSTSLFATSTASSERYSVLRHEEPEQVPYHSLLMPGRCRHRIRDSNAESPSLSARIARELGADLPLSRPASCPCCAMERYKLDNTIRIASGPGTRSANQGQFN